MLHTVIQGPPGVGKTMLGEIIGEIYYKLDINLNLFNFIIIYFRNIY